MGITNQVADVPDEVDVIIAGGGTAGCVIAARLSDADPNLSIVVIERGHDNYNDPTVYHPLFWLTNILELPEPNPRMMYYRGQSEPDIAGRKMSVAAGSILGGGSSINMMTYSRGHRGDMNDWGAPGWSADDMVPYLKKFETYHGPGTSDTHGNNGPIHVSAGSWGPSALQPDLINAATEAGFPETTDAQDLESLGFQRNLRYIDEDGKRQDAAHAYIHPRLRDGAHPNLLVLTEHHVSRVIIEGDVASGVELQATSSLADNSTFLTTIKARKMVIVSSGTLGTPLILERSGIGAAEVLRDAGVPVVVDLPGVGENFMDHNLVIVPYYSTLATNETYDTILSGEETFEGLIGENASILAFNGAEVTSKVRPSDDEAAAMGPAFLEAWNRDFRNRPNRPLASINSASGFTTALPEDDTAQHFLSASSFSLYPYSRGSIHITGPSALDPPSLRTGILSDPDGIDEKMAAWVYKTQREVFRRLEMYRGEYAPLHPPFAADSEAVCGRAAGPPPKDAPPIRYTAEDEAVLSKWLRENVGQNWHGLGTCKMAPLNEAGVVHARLGVYGVKGLKVADLSVSPVNVAANTASAAFAIGEKAADIFIKELGLGCKVKRGAV
ncbi:GMC oxidoreductase-domain-containing protein [Plectosphaerella plurivora]|uniref:GMC oxidoreductase-domain-containing protein n=1 Tax=Plectosphaerella plurivora TaxID=936078 RepID=A0A9P8VEI8_9PEZI|nr:GMC oxidoreductase-domain-containing protein [Plectosphaerella plurivora]